MLENICAAHEAVLDAAADRYAWSRSLSAVAEIAGLDHAGIFVLRDVCEQDHVCCLGETTGAGATADLERLADAVWRPAASHCDWVGLEATDGLDVKIVHGSPAGEAMDRLVLTARLDVSRRFSLIFGGKGEVIAALRRRPDFLALCRLIRQAIMMNVREALHLKREKALLTQVNAAPVAVLLLNARGQVMQMNDLAHAILESADALAVEKGRLRVFGEDRSSARFNRMTAEILEASRRGRLHKDAVYQLNDATGLPVYYIRVHGLIAASDDADEPAAIVTISDSNIARWLSEKSVAELFSLTGTEARLAIHLAQGRTLADYAATREISEYTARTHMRNIFAKLGVNRQNELIQLIMGSASVCVSRQETPPWIDIKDLVYSARVRQAS